MQRLLKIDPRPIEYESLVEARLDATQVQVNPTVEMARWHPVRPLDAALPATMAFVDGVQRIELRLSAEGDGYPIPGALASCAAGAVCIGVEPRLNHVRVDRRVILAKGATAQPLRLEASNGPLEYLPAHNAGEDFESINIALGDLRAGLEVQVAQELIKDNIGLVVVDGRLPGVGQGPVLGLIKTLHNLYISEPEHLATLTALKTGERSPVFSIQRARTTYYSWFVCLCTPGPFDVALSGLVRLEMDDSASRAEAFQMADSTASLLPGFASTPHRDPRAPQNLLPVGQLEQELRHRLGDLELVKRLVFKAFREERPAWNP